MKSNKAKRNKRIIKVEMSSYYYDGRFMASNGCHVGDNPYLNGTLAYSEWLKGWQDEKYSR